MTFNCDAETATLAREMAAKQLDVESQALLIERLERDGHDMLEQRLKLAKDRSDLARQKAQLARLPRDNVHSGERRKLEHIDVDEVAYISGDGSSLRCRVINMSAQGAAIELPTKRYVSSTFKLMLAKDRILRSCRLVWSSGDRIGLLFEDHL